MSLMEAVSWLCYNATTIFDVGAKHGDYAQAFAELASEAIVYAFEPEPHNYEILAQKDHPGVIPINLAIYKDCGQYQLNRYLHSGSHSFLHPDKLDPGVSLGPVAVRAVSLDAFCEELEITKIDLLKIDVEGAEYQVLEGAAGLFEHGAVGVVIVELMHYPYFEGQSNPEDIEEFLRTYGMWCVDTFPVRWENEVRYTNAVFVKKEQVL